MAPTYDLIFPIKILADFLHSILSVFHSIGLSWGLCIIALTILVRLVLLPLNLRQVRSMQRMQEIQPQIKKIQEKYKGMTDKDSRQAVAAETMAVYQEHSINPLGAFAPLLIQIPVFISLFYMLKGAPFRHDLAGDSGFLFIPDLSRTLSDHTGILLLLFGLYFITQATSIIVGARERDKKIYLMALILPLLFGLFISSFPAGVIVYWIASNTWTIGQGLLFKRLAPTKVLPLTDDAAPELPPTETATETPRESGAAAAPPATPATQKKPAQRKKRKHGRR